MRRLKTILWALLIGTMVMSAAELTATVTKYNEAELSGDVSSSMSVSFLNQVKNKGTVGQGDTAVLRLNGIPSCTITDVVLYAHSNKKSGGADVTLTINEYTEQVAEGSFKDWPGVDDFSSEIIPVPLWKGKQEVEYGSTFVLTMAGTTNSVTIDRVTITYLLSAPVAHTVTLHWVDAEFMPQSQSMMEEKAGEGVRLPAVMDTIRDKNGTSWTFAGWSEQMLTTTDEEPRIWEAENWYIPEQDMDLYGVYTDKQTGMVLQDTTYQSGSYAVTCLWLDSTWMLNGGWNDGRIAIDMVETRQSETGLYQLSMQDVTTDNVYSMTFTGDSVFIRSLATMSYIGYSAAGVTKMKKAWAWRKAAYGSIYIYSQQVPGPTQDWLGMALKPEMDVEGKACVKYGKEVWKPSYTYWILFPITELPTEVIHWTTFPEATALVEQAIRAKVNKIMLNGRIWIVSDDIYDLMGNKR